MRKTLLIFDDSIDIEDLGRKLCSVKIDELDLLPLTSRWDKIREIEVLCNSKNRNIRKINLLESARLINNQVDKVRERISSWSANLGDCNVCGRSVKERFLVPKKEVSTWWFSLISEKNVFKTDVFFHIAQLQAVSELLKTKEYKLCFLGSKNKKWQKAAKLVSKKYCFEIKLLKLQSISKKEWLVEFARKSGFIKDFFYSLFWLLRVCFRGLKAKTAMGSLVNRQAKKDSVLFVTYFPAVDKEAAERGIFRNRYAMPLQDKLSQMKKTINWLLMHVPIEKQSYNKSLKLGKKFADKGELIFFIEEFLSIRVIFYSIYIWIKQIFMYMFLTFNLNPRFLTDGLTMPEADILLYPLWQDSFVGKRGMEGIIYFELYKKVFSYFNDVSHCIYYAEMQAWEKALNAAKKIKAKKIKTIGFQHVSIGRNFFSYLYQNREMKDRESLIALPLPDILACNGDVSYEFLKEINYPNVKKVEAVRQHYLFNYLKNDRYREKGEQILLIVGSYYAKETSLLISFFQTAFRGSQPFKVWIKGHPMTPVEEVFELLKIDYQKCGYEIKKNPVSTLLEKATMVLVGFSTVGVEALTCGCQVFIPVFSDQMFISSLLGFERYYSQVISPQDFKDEIEKFIKYGKKFESNEIKDFISRYWCLDESLSRWKHVVSGAC